MSETEESSCGRIRPLEPPEGNDDESADDRKDPHPPTDEGRIRSVGGRQDENGDAGEHGEVEADREQGGVVLSVAGPRLLEEEEPDVPQDVADDSQRAQRDRDISFHDLSPCVSRGFWGNFQVPCSELMATIIHEIYKKSIMIDKEKAASWRGRHGEAVFLPPE